MKVFLTFSLFIYVFCITDTQAQNNLQNLNCYYMDRETRHDDLWVIDAEEMIISYWNNQDNLFESFPITKLDNKTVAWNQIGTVLTVFVLDKSTLRQSGTIISTNQDGQSIIEKRWFSDCNFISSDQLDTLTQARQAKK